MRRAMAWISMVGACGLALGWLAGDAGLVAAEELKVPVTKDAWISAANKDEVDTNMGAAKTMKLKVWQEFGLIDFDLSALKGRQIKSAELYIHPVVEAGQARSPLNWIVLSTITSPWEEGKAAAEYTLDVEGHGACYTQASYQKRDWAWKGSKACDVILGNGNSLRDDVRLSDAGDGWWKMPVRADLMTALVAGSSHGLMIMDGSTGVNMNSMVYQREEAGKGAYLLVQLEGEDRQAPAAVTGLAVTAAPNAASVEAGAVTMELSCPAEAACLNILADGKALPRYLIPQPKAGAMQFELTDLPADQEIEFSIAVVDASGNASAAVTVKAKTSGKISVPKLPVSAWQPQGGKIPLIGAALRVWAIPELVKTDPLTGKVRFEGGAAGAADYSVKNTVFDGATSTVHLPAARAEIVSFQLVVEASEGELKEIAIAVSDLKNGENTIARQGVKLWRIWYVEGEAEYCVPLTGTCEIPARDNIIQGQKTQQITVDVWVPKTTPPGLYKGTVTVSAAAGIEAKLPLEIQVYSAVIPDELNFNPELNTYGGPGEAGSKKFNEYHKLAHYHRCTINRVPYSQSGRSHGDMAPGIDANGKIVDWTAYDKAVGPLLTGELFKDNPRAGVPVRTFYLPLFEAWPLPLTGHYNPGPQAPVPTAETADKTWKDEHDIHAKPIAEALDAAYKKAWVDGVKEFVRHFEQKGYTRTACELYLNNKYGDFKKSSYWTLDEPFEALDWHALKYYSVLFHEGIQEVKRPDWFVYRGDISRPQWQGNYMDGWMEYMYVNSGAFGMARLVRNTRNRSNMHLYVYGSANHPSRAAHETTAWCYKSLFIDGEGVLPWQSMGDIDNLMKLTKDSTLALMVPGQDFGVEAVASIRVHALRRGAQDAELMLLLQKKMGWSRQHLEALAAQRIVLSSDFRPVREDDAAAVTFEGLSSSNFAEVKEGVLMLLEPK